MFLNTKCGSSLGQVSARLLRNIRKYGKMSKLYRPANILPPGKEKEHKSKKEQMSKSQRLMLDTGLIQLSNTSGTYHLLPIAARSLDKLIGIIEMFMEKVDSQKIRMPTLASSKVWSATGRLENFGPELLMLKDRHGHGLVLCPTHEEVICDLLSVHPLSHRALPLKLYQITEKFRDEKRPRFGLLRGREFLMKDLYTFDADEKSAEATYHEMNNLYTEMLNHLGVKFARVQGSSGLMGGKLSHEFHLISNVGEDKILICTECQFGYNQEIEVKMQQQQSVKTVNSGSATEIVQSMPSKNPLCPQCGSNLSRSNGIEVAHSFLLGTKYTEAFQTCSSSTEGPTPSVLHMGCYGVGVTRLLASTIEVLSSEEEIKWPLAMAPYLLAFIPPKQGSKEEQSKGMELANKLHTFLVDLLPKDLLIDDRTEMTIGRRLKDIRKLGVPYVIVCGKLLADEEPKVELIDVYNNSTKLLNSFQVFNHIYDLKSSLTFL